MISSSLMKIFCIGAACYPEGHVESVNKTADIEHLREKVEAGCDFVTTQMFFDNNILYNYLYRIRERGITVPVVAGIMPVTNVKQIKRICQMSGTYLPARFKAIVDRFGDNPAAMKQAGIAYATEQIIDLIANHVNGIHVYSMNKPDVAAKNGEQSVGNSITGAYGKTDGRQYKIRSKAGEKGRCTGLLDWAAMSRMRERRCWWRNPSWSLKMRRHPDSFLEVTRSRFFRTGDSILPASGWRAGICRET